MLRSALAYARRNIPVLPLAGKVPMTENGLHDATTDQNALRRMWTRHYDANIGLVTGERSGFFVLDVDGKEGRETLSALERVHGNLPATVHVLTPGGGDHYYFKHVDGLRNRVKFADGLDIRATGGLVVAPPSYNRETGVLYVFAPDCANAFANAPDWLLGMVRAPRIALGDPATGIINEGQRNDALTRMTGKLLRQWGLDGPLVLDLVLAWNAARCVPPLAEKEVVRTFESVVRLENERRERYPDAPRLEI